MVPFILALLPLLQLHRLALCHQLPHIARLLHIPQLPHLTCIQYHVVLIVRYLYILATFLSRVLERWVLFQVSKQIVRVAGPQSLRPPHLFILVQLKLQPLYLLHLLCIHLICLQHHTILHLSHQHQRCPLPPLQLRIKDSEKALYPLLLRHFNHVSFLVLRWHSLFTLLDNFFFNTLNVRDGLWNNLSERSWWRMQLLSVYSFLRLVMLWYMLS